LTDAPKKKHPLLEREFLMAALTFIGGIVLFLLGKEDIGVTLIVAATGGFAVSRGLAKIGSGAKLVLIFLLPILIIGCCGDAYVRKDSIDGLINKVSDRHDRFIKGEATAADKDPDKKASHLRSTELLRKVVDEPEE
jgi:hypothetical protein